MSSRLGDEMHMSKKDHSWCLVLVIWGEKYSDKFVDTLVKSVKQHSKGCKHIVLITDHIRNDLSDNIVQKLIPDFFNQPLFFKGGYVVKLSLFHKSVLPSNMPCVYMDLDTIVVGDLGNLADFAGIAIMGDKVLLKNFDSVETSCGDGFELF